MSYVRTKLKGKHTYYNIKKHGIQCVCYICETIINVNNVCIRRYDRYDDVCSASTLPTHSLQTRFQVQHCTPCPVGIPHTCRGGRKDCKSEINCVYGCMRTCVYVLCVIVRMFVCVYSTYMLILHHSIRQPFIPPQCPCTNIIHKY